MTSEQQQDPDRWNSRVSRGVEVVYSTRVGLDPLEKSNFTKGCITKSMGENPDFLTLYVICDITLIHKQKVQDHEISAGFLMMAILTGIR